MRVLTGPFFDISGTVIDVDEFMRHVWIVVLFFGRELSISLDVLNVEAVP